MLRVLADLHHAELFYSLQLLFEKRLGAEMYRPIGMDWYYEGYWHVYPHIGTARQYLATDQAHNVPIGIEGNPFPKEQLLNRNYRFDDGIYYVTDVTKEKIQRGVTLEKFKDMDFDIALSSMPVHIQPFNELIRLYQPQAKHIFQVGNAWGRLPGVKNILASTAPFSVPSDVNVCFYHQEFDLGDFYYEPPTNRTDVRSYVHWMKRKELMNSYDRQLPGCSFHSYGAGMEDSILKTKDIAAHMRDSAFTWHYKPEGDGYGHILHDTFAVGRPPIIWGSHYRGKLAARLFENGVNCLDVDELGDPTTLKTLGSMSPDEHDSMCKAARQRFDEVVNFNEEEQRIRNFLEELR